MADFGDLILALTCRLVHDEDFSFSADRGQIANRLRVALASAELSTMAIDVRNIEIDSDGDITVQTGNGLLYVTASSVFVSGWLTSPDDMSAGQHIAEVSKIIDLLLSFRAPLQPKRYQTRLFFSARFLPKHSAGLPVSRCPNAALQTILGDSAPSQFDNFSMTNAFTTGQFSDILDLEGSKRDIQLRYGREIESKAFDSYQSFLRAADLPGMVRSLRSFIEMYTSDPSKLLGRVFKEKKPPILIG